MANHAANDRCKGGRFPSLTRVGVVSLSGGSDFNRRPRKGLQWKLTFGNRVQTASKKSMERMRNSVFYLRTVAVTKSQLERKARPEGCAQQTNTMSPETSRPDNSAKGNKSTSQKT